MAAATLDRSYEIRMKGIYAKIRKSQKTCFLPKDLKDDFEIIAWDDKTPDLKPVFFEQLPSELLEPPCRQQKLDMRKVADKDFEATYCTVVGTGYNEFTGGFDEKATHSEFYKNLRTYWEELSYNLLPKDVPSPPFRCGGGIAQKRAEKLHCRVSYSWHETKESEGILYTELGILLKLILWEGRKDYPHDIVPVLLVSIREGQNRVFEAYYNGEKIVLRCSDPRKITAQDSPEEIRAKLEWLVGWGAARAVGDTKCGPSLRALKSIPTNVPSSRNFAMRPARK